MNDRAREIENQMSSHDPFVRMGLPPGGDGLTSYQLNLARRQLEGDAHTEISDPVTRNRVLDLIAKAHEAASASLSGSGPVSPQVVAPASAHLAEPPAQAVTQEAGTRRTNPLLVVIIAIVGIGALLVGVVLINQGSRSSGSRSDTGNSSVSDQARLDIGRVLPQIVGGAPGAWDQEKPLIEDLRGKPRSPAESAQYADVAVNLVSEETDYRRARFFQLAGDWYLRASTDVSDPDRDWWRSSAAGSYLSAAICALRDGWDKAACRELAYKAREFSTAGSETAKRADELLEQLTR